MTLDSPHPWRILHHVELQLMIVDDSSASGNLTLHRNLRLLMLYVALKLAL